MDIDNFVQFAKDHYDNPHCKTEEEFEEDLHKFVYLKKLFAKDELNIRLILNHIIVLYNIFEIDACTKMLFFKIDRNNWSDLKTFLTYLNFMPLEIQDIGVKMMEIPTNEKILEELKKI